MSALSGYTRGPEVVGLGQQMDIKARLQAEHIGLTRRIGEIEEALSLLDRNPDIERLMNILR